ncbi:hypothetical protein MSP7336_04619 [Mycobacterium shimoidei]|uniref:Uncharacterized protein n=2 Tax=Mycobacterium shimoidei TaxID=29313 RepID=A0A375Z588_MYCSH|nr:hypothetical protein MSP7336_04619 [Mycobacterium shimoidei]
MMTARPLGWHGSVGLSRAGIATELGGYPDAVNVPGSVRLAGLIVAVQGATALAVALILLLRRLGGVDPAGVNGFATAVWFAVVGAGVLAAGWALTIGKQWGRGPAVFVELLLLPVAWYLAVGSNRPLIGIPVAVVALTVLALLFSPPTLRWISDGRRQS